MKAKAWQQYLQRYAEPETQLLSTWQGSKTYSALLVIPIYQEPLTWLETLEQAEWFTADVLIILVINQPDTQTDSIPQQQFFHAIRQAGELTWQADSLCLIHFAPTSPRVYGDILLVDRFNKPLPASYGVGLARKIGADLAVALMQCGVVTTDWIHSSDADAQLPAHYFSVLSTLSPVLSSKASAAYYAFEHDGGSEAVLQATLCYQASLHYYVAGLRYAGSPYAHYAIGSTLAFKAHSYVQARGFPKRAAGEDFYLLNKLAKLGQILSITQATIRLQARLSERVPFGTGTASNAIMHLIAQGKAFHYYDPQTFVLLRQVLAHFALLWDIKDGSESGLRPLPVASRTALSQLGMEAFIANIYPKCRTKAQFLMHMTHWFDGLKTLRFIHLLRDHYYPNIPLAKALATAPFTVPAITPADQQRARLDFPVLP